MRAFLVFCALLCTLHTVAAHAEGEGKSVVQRNFDKKGRLNEVTFIDYGVTPPQTERLSIIHEPIEQRIRTTERGKQLLRQETEKYAEPGVLSEREIIWSSTGDGKLDRRTVMTYVGPRVKVVEYELDGKTWKAKSEQEYSTMES